MGRNILFITTDQQRYDALGCNGGKIAKTPVVDRLAASGINYHRAHNQNVVCMPARATMISGQYVRTHGVFANGVALPPDAPSVAAYLHERAGYRTALLGKAHFEPALDFTGRWPENTMGRKGSTGPWRGFERMELAMHVPLGGWHYSVWLQKNYPNEVGGFAPLLSATGGGDTGAPEVKYNPIPREHYHTDWVADRTIAFLDSLDPNENWFVWMSFPDPHHPWDPPESEARRINWRDLELPAGHPGSREKIEAILRQKPRHWLDWYEGRFRNFEGGPIRFIPAQMTHDQVREINAMTHVENELIDEACGRVLRRIAERKWDDRTDVFFTTDHGELQGDFGLVFKGPYHVDALMRIPMIWRPAPSAKVSAAQIAESVGQLDLAPTFCEIAGVPVPAWMDGKPLPVTSNSGRQRVITEWDSQFAQVGMHLKSIYRDGYVCTVYEKSTRDIGFDLGSIIRGPLGGPDIPMPDVTYDGTEGELYNLREDPLQWRNLWNDAGFAKLKADLIADLYDNLPPARDPQLPVEAAHKAIKMNPLTIVGGYGSPYSRKMRAVLRYRRIPFRWIMRGSAEDVGIPPVPVALIPVLVFPGSDGIADEAMIDSTFQILRLEKMRNERSLIPSDPALAFLQSLIEDYADEWLTKAMFHYRWNYAPDIHKASQVLILDRMPHLEGERLERAAKMIAERQIARLTVVGSNSTTRAVIEDSYQRLLSILDHHVAGGSLFLMGGRPGVGDFGLFGQLSQLTHFDPTPSAIAAEQAPRVYAWVNRMEDLGSIEVADDGWTRRELAAASLQPLLCEIGRVYAPFLIANARALNSKAAEVRAEIDGRPWIQQPFAYQGKCLKWLREAHLGLTASDRGFVDQALSGTGCEAIFTASI